MRQGMSPDLRRGSRASKAASSVHRSRDGAHGAARRAPRPPTLRPSTPSHGSQAGRPSRTSPDGRYLAYDDGRPTPSVYVFDIAAGTERTIGPGLGPLWLESELLAVTEARPCRDDEVCGDHAGPRWRGTGHVSAVSLPDGSGRALSLTSTIDADVLYA